MIGTMVGWYAALQRKLNSGGATGAHYDREAGKVEHLFQDWPEAEPETNRPNLELHEFNGDSEDIDWMAYNHDTGEVLIQFLEHGEHTEHAHLYSYPDLPYEEFEKLKTGEGPFPTPRKSSWGYISYTKVESTGQRANYHLRNDQQDDKYDYGREG